MHSQLNPTLEIKMPSEVHLAKNIHKELNMSSFDIFPISLVLSISASLCLQLFTTVPSLSAPTFTRLQRNWVSNKFGCADGNHGITTGVSDSFFREFGSSSYNLNLNLYYWSHPNEL